MLRSGDIIDGIYQIIRGIGKGGTGIIYLGYHLRLQKQVVIKKMKENYTGRMNVRAEADILKKLHHTYLPQVYDFLVAGTDVYTVMDYIPGHDIQYYLDNNYTFPEKTVVLWLGQMCEVLEYLHTRKPKILHSDIKPGNIMVTPEGNICLIDFNISLDGENVQEIQGLSQYYAAPEQYTCAMDKLYGRTGRIVPDERMDIYSTGAVFYRMMTGQYPSPQTGAPYPIMEMELPYSDGLKSIVAKAMELSPQKRFRTAGQMKKALENIERMDPGYRLFTNLQLTSVMIYALCIAAGILLISAGAGQYQKESWQEKYASFYKAAESGDETMIVTEGTGLLNDFVLQGYLKDHPEKQAEVLHTVGDSYFRREQYDTASEYYEDALNADADEALYLRDYMVSVVRSGQYLDMEAIEKRYPEAGLNEAETIFVQAEATAAGDSNGDALELAEEALTLSTDPELNARIYSLQVDIYTVAGEYAAAAQAAEDAAGEVSDINLIRRAGELTFAAGNAEDRDTVKNAWYGKALGYYERLCARAGTSYEDRMSLALVFRALGRYGNSLDCLEEMKADYPEDYKILMWMCYNYLDEMTTEGTQEKREGDLGFCYNSCRHMYERETKEDPNMELLIELMEQYE